MPQGVCLCVCVELNMNSVQLFTKWYAFRFV